MEKFKSRKFWFAFSGAVLPIMGQFFSSSVSLEEALQLSSAIVIAYIFGQGYVDGQSKKDS